MEERVDDLCRDLKELESKLGNNYYMLFKVVLLRIKLFITMTCWVTDHVIFYSFEKTCSAL